MGETLSFSDHYCGRVLVERVRREDIYGDDGRLLKVALEVAGHQKGEVRDVHQRQNPVSWLRKHIEPCYQ